MQKLVVLFFCLLCLAPEVDAQEQRLPSCEDLSNLTLECTKQLEKWQNGEKMWREWLTVNGSHRVATSRSAWDRYHPARPYPPGWVIDGCEPQIKNKNITHDICHYYLGVLNYDWVANYVGRPLPVRLLNKAQGKEYTDFWSWLTRSLHFNAGWIPASTRGDRIVLIGGVHLELVQVSNRISLFGPGIMFSRVPDGTGKQVLRAGDTWGLSIRLKDFRFPLTGKDYSLHFNFAKYRMGGGPTPGETMLDSNRNVMGLSLSRKK